VISKSARTLGTVCTITAALAVGVAPSASAKGGDGIRVKGFCTGGTSSDLKLKHDDGRIEAEFEVDQNRTGVHWNVQLLRNGRPACEGARKTVAPSGSFSLERRLAGSTAPVTIRARATRTGEVCTATATI
jgi:hypothetical protein